MLNFLQITYSIGVYELDGNFVYYTNKDLPNLNLNITSPSEPIIIYNANISINNVFSNENYNKKLKAGDSVIINYNFSKKILSTDIIKYKLIAKGLDDKLIIPAGDPTDFFIKLDNIKPTLKYKIAKSYQIINSGSRNIKLEFSEKISEYNVFFDGVKNKNFINPSKFSKDFKKNIELNFSSNQLHEGVNKILIEYFDLAKNKNTIELDIFFRGPPITAKLITNFDDKSLSYYYNVDYKEFFNGSIYSKNNNFKLKIETSKKSNCYFSDSLSSFESDFNKVVSKSEFITKLISSDGKTHSIDVSIPNNIWVACQNKIFSDDVVFLNDALGINGLIKLQKDSGVSFKFEKTIPNREVTSNILDIIINTNKNSICSYKLDSFSSTYIENSNISNDFNHIKKNVEILNGDHNINFNCFDRVGTFISKPLKFNVDSNKGVRIYGKFPFYTNSQSNKINFSLSENVVCKYTKNNDGFTPSKFNLLENISGVGLERFFLTTSIIRGSNIYYIKCDKNKIIVDNQIEVIYDDLGPQISNLTFLNDGIESKYLGNLNKISLKFDVESLIPISKYFFEFVKDNKTVMLESKSNEVSFSLNLSQFDKVKVIGQNIIGVNSSSIEKTLIFDLNKPKLDILISGKTFKISCYDPESINCKLVNYGLSKTNIDCKTNLNYENNSSINFEDNYYSCAKGIDYAGNFEEIIKPLISGFGKLKINKSEFIFNESLGNKSKNTQNNNDSNYSDEFLTQGDFPVNNDQGGSNYLLITAIFILIAGVSSGGYYAYRKGYLNEQFKKMGIKIPNNNSRNNNNNNKLKSKNNLFTKNNSSNKNSNLKEVSKSKYDKHLNKLNDFIDEKINGSNKIFDSFNNDNSKGKVKGYKDTLLSKNGKGAVSKKEFDEFYSSSKDILKNNYNNIEKDAEDFEKFHKKNKNNKK